MWRPGIDLREADQLELLKKLAAYYDELPFPAQPLTVRLVSSIALSIVV